MNLPRTNAITAPQWLKIVRQQIHRVRRVLYDVKQISTSFTVAVSQGDNKTAPIDGPITLARFHAPFIDRSRDPPI